ncbi:hypothetical protein HHI36_023795 [Cryptolaemus montrouzieri]|uniref:Uncharacterized protein n=1 Tax=Cryptolaemus montrouzieri TaxID=559131 RepID=A0ABD2PI54_9CUCU
MIPLTYIFYHKFTKDFVSIDGKHYIGEELHQLFLDREEDHDSEEEYRKDGDVTVESKPDPNNGFDGDAGDAATNRVPATMHHDNKVDEDSKKPDIILYYNATKAGVDALNQLCTIRAVEPEGDRWPFGMQ